MAPPASALAVANDLKVHLLAAGVPQVSIELQIGRSSRWVSSGGFRGMSFVANLGHHIASRPSASNPTPGLAVVKNGRPGIPGPLCNGYGGMNLIARIICLDWANHPGEGGPWTVDGYTVPRDGGRPYLFGWEHEGGYSTAVWDAVYTNKATGKRMTYREFMGRCHAGTLRWLGRPRTSHGEHRTWADLKQVGRKIDRLGYTRSSGIAELTPYYLNQEDDVELSDKIPLTEGASANLNGMTTITVGGALGYAAAGGFQAIHELPRIIATQKVIVEVLNGLPDTGDVNQMIADAIAQVPEVTASDVAELLEVRSEVIVRDDVPPA